MTAIDRSSFADDGVRLHWRDRPGDPQRPAILCLPGLTRNLRDFEQIAQWLSPRFRVITISFRGRGESGHARDPLTYVPLTYCRDLGRVLGEAGAGEVIVIGTSLGGNVALLMEGLGTAKIAGLVLNDVGPELEAEGLARVKAGLGRGQGWPTWLHAARAIAARDAAIFPDFTIDEWLAHAHRLCRETPAGRIVFDHDPAIALPLERGGAEPAANLWPLVERFGDRPVLSLRGELSDILSAEGQARLAERLPRLVACTIPRVGHAPTLDEPGARQAIEAWLAAFA